MGSTGGLFYTGYNYGGQFTPEKRLPDAKTGDLFVIEDLLDFPSDEVSVGAAVAGISTESSTGMAVENTLVSSVNTAKDPPVDTYHSAGIAGNFSGELRVPDDMAELEWLSNFVDESFSSEEDLQKLHLIQGIKARPEHTSRPHHQIKFPHSFARPELPVALPAKARSKRSRAANGNWASRLSSALSPSTESGSQKKEEAGVDVGGEGRRCLHCAADKTPQWRTGPMGPKTLCNACGVRYKSGRLVPEYRPAASPTFVLTKHSNSHRKVLELRRQKEMLRTRNHHHPPQFMSHRQNVMLDVSNSEDYLIHQVVGPDFRQLI